MGGAMGGTVFSISLLTMLAAFVFYFYPFSVRCGVWLWRMDNTPSTPLPVLLREEGLLCYLERSF